MYRIRLTPAQVSAIECRPPGDFRLDGDYLIGRPGTAARLCEASNAEDYYAEYVATDPILERFARRAAKSLASLYLKALRLEDASA